MIKIVSFDIGGTLLLNSKEQDKYSLNELANLVDKEYKEVRIVYKDVFQKTKGTFDELVSLFCKKLDIDLEDKIIAFFQNKFSHLEESIINKDALELLKQLKSKGIKIICLSNSNVLINSGIPLEMKEYIDEVYYSYDLGYTKNDDELYDIMIQKLGVLPEEILHIGDTYKADYEMPLKHGWNVFYYGKSDQNIISSENILDAARYL